MFGFGQTWDRVFEATSFVAGTSVQQTTDGGSVITRKTKSTRIGGVDIYLIKTDDNGNIISTFNIPINANRKSQKTVDILGKEINQ